MNDSSTLAMLRALGPIVSYSKRPAAMDTGLDETYPPMVWWTFAPSVDSSIDPILKNAVSSFRGEVDWKLVVHSKHRYGLMPTRIALWLEGSERDGKEDIFIRLRRCEPEFGRRANRDLDALLEHICRHCTSEVQSG